MPVAADVVDLVRVLSHLSDIRVTLDGLEEAVDVDLAPPLGEFDVLLGGDVLVTEEDDAVVYERLAQLGELFVPPFLSCRT